MKKMIALVLAGLMLLGGVCLAGQWSEGRSAAQPYPNLPEVNLSETIGYIMLFPRAKLPVTRFCDVLEMYLPREDIVAGEGLVHLYEKVDGESVEVCYVDFSNPDDFEIREMSDEELEDLVWGGGTCIEMYLPKSLEFGNGNHEYYVLMDAGCFTAAEGNLNSLQITSEEAWTPVISGEYGISGLYYLDAPLPVEAKAADGEEAEESEEGEEAEEEEAGDEAAEKPAEEETAKADEKEKAEAAEESEGTEAAEETPIDPSMYVTKPDPGDKVHFDLVIGGDAKLAVFYSENGSVDFEQIEFSESGPVVGTVIGKDVQWGVAFYDENDYIFDTINFGR